jgi:ABC-type dipeptide/oligopeptide/nickel transport system permease subunit
MTTGSPTELFRLLTASRLTRAALVALAVLYTIVAFAPIFAAHPPELILRAPDGSVLASHPPTMPQWDGEGLHYQLTRRERDTTTYAVTFRPVGRAPLRFLAAGRLLSGERFMPLGTDRLGRDLWSRIVYGGRVSLSVGLIGVTISMAIGAFLGGLAGTVGGRVDMLIMRLTEMVMMVPSLYLLLTLAAVLPKNLTSAERYVLIIVVLSTIRWAGLARVIRGMVLSIRERDFVQAAVAAGAGRVRLLWKYILPNTASYLIVAATLQIPGYILGESALSLLGLGIQEPEASWGNLLIDAKSGSAILLAPWLLIPGLFIVLAIVLFNVIGDALRDAWDPGSEGFLL